MVDLSSYVETLEGKPVAVFGLGASGLSTCKALINANASVTAWDDKEESRHKAQELGADLQDLGQIDLNSYAFLILGPGVHYTFEPHPVVLNAQKFDVEIIGDIELLHRTNHGIKTIGITGTNGKSTTTALMNHVLNECGMKSVMGGNIGKPVFDLNLDTDYLVLEISSYQMDLCPTFRPDISVLLNITPDHLDRHGGMEEYVAAKERILEGEGLAVIGTDDDFTQELFNKIFFAGKRKAFPVSVKAKIDEGFYVFDDYLYQNTGGNDVLIGPMNEFEKLKGLHNYQNTACVYVVAKQLGVSDEKIFNAVKGFPGLAHRQYMLCQENNVSYINDSKATNGEASAKALSSYDNIYWIIGGRAKEGGLQGLEIFKDKIEKTYVIGEASKDFSVWLKKNNFKYVLCKTLDVATKKAHKDAQKSEKPSTVLLSPACASWDQFSSFEARGDFFADQVQKLVKGT